jgi:[acyl-carrier-protein] S-malonyltransferase
VTAGAARVALVFPGQGSQVVGMGRAVAEAFPEARAVFERADAALQEPLSRVCFEGPEEALRLTATTQPAILTTSVALLAALQAAAPGLEALVVCAAGHSLGEYTALVASGALELEDAVRTVRRRGRYMQEAVPVGQGAMAAVLGAPLEAVEELCRAAAGGDVLAPANLNAPDQIVVAGSAAAVKRMIPLAKEHGARRVMELPVSAPFHCALMKPAQDRLGAVLETLVMRDASYPVVNNATAEAETRADRLRGALEAQVTSPVRWVESVTRLRALGAGTQIEIGPGKVLSGLARRIDPALQVLNVEDPASLEGTVRALASGAGAR